MPFLHPAFIRRVLGVLECSDGTDVCLPVARGYKQPLAAAYRVSLAEAAERLVKEDRLRPAFLFDECRVETLDDAALKRDPVLAALDPDLDSVLNVNTPADYAAARARPGPEVTVQLFGTLAKGNSSGGRHVVRAATVGGAADVLGIVFDRHVTAALNGDQITRDRATPARTGRCPIACCAATSAAPGSALGCCASWERRAPTRSGPGPRWRSCSPRWSALR